MTNIKQRAQELLTCDELRGRLPDEVRAFLRDVVALEPVGYVHKAMPEHFRQPDSMLSWSYVWQSANANSNHPIYDLEAPNDPA